MPEPRPELRRAAERSVARWARMGLFAYPLMAAVLTVTTDLWQRHPVATALVVAGLVALAVGRTVAVVRFDALYEGRPRLWSLLFYGGLLASLVPISAIACYSLIQNGLDVDSLVAVAVISFLAPVAILVYSLKRRLSRLYLALLLGPLLVTLLYVRPGSFGVWPSIWLALYALYLVRAGDEQHRDRWSALESNHLLVERAAELERAHRELSAGQAELESLVAERTEELHQTSQKYQQIFDSAHDPILIFDPVGEVVLNVNRRACEIYGFTREEFIGRSLLPLSETPERGQDQIAKTIEKGSFYNFETRQKRQDGTWMDLEVNASTLTYEGKLAILSINRDVTEQRKTRELRLAKDAAERADRAKGQFLANMSHEIRTPMAGIMGLTDLLLKTELSAGQASYAQMIQASTGSLLQLIDDILDFSKIEAGRLAIARTSFDLRTTLEETVQLLRFQARSKGLALSLAMAEDLPRWVEGDPGRLRQVVINLVGNSIKFTDRGSVEVEVAPLLGEYVGFTVRDTGIGIPEEIHDRLFAPFSQADSSTSRRFGGTGLGLAISKRIVELMGGEISFVSHPGAGSTFWFTVHLQPGAPHLEGRPAGEAPAATASPEPRHILVAEDNPINQLVVTQQLQVLGYDVTAVSNGVEALAALARRPFDLVLMDCQMPELDGYEATRRMRHQAGAASRIPVIALTAHAMKGDREKCLEAGMNDYLTKPFRVDSLRSMLDKWLGGRPADSPGA